MHLYSVIFILALLAFGGIAAYLGDILGYRLGKRRFSLLRLRPRTTARLVGILAGILIPAVTVLVGYWQVDYVRMALVELDDLRRDLDGLRHDRDTMQEQRDVARKERDQARNAANRAQAEAVESRNEFEGVKADLNTAKDRLDDARARVSGLRAESGRLRGDKERVQRDLGKARQSLDEAEIAIDRVEIALGKAEDSLKKVEREKGDAERERERLKGEVAKLKDQYRDLEVSIREELEDAHSVFARRLPIFDIGTELVRGVVARPADLDSLKNKIVALLVLADQAAEAAGAARGENDRYVRAILPRPADTPLEEDERPPESRVLGSVVRQLWEAAEQSHVVRVIAARRSFAGEQVYVGFAAEPNRLVFREGETIVSRRIEAGVDEADAFEQLWLLIADPARSEVRKQAQAAGLLPDPKTGRYGEVQVRELFRAAQECARRTGPRAVRVEAAEDTYTAGPLSIEIVVEPSEGGRG